MEFKYSVFDTMLNSEDEMIKQANINKGQACVYLRAYIMIRLLLFGEIVVSDSSINLNRALRTLILENEGKGEYDLSGLPTNDKFDELIEKGYIKLAVRDIYKDNFSESLRVLQNNKKHIDLPSEKYTRHIDEICKNGDNIYWWNAEEVSKNFTKNIRDKLKTQFSPEINIFLRGISDSLREYDTLTYNKVKNEVLNRGYKENSDEYQIVRGMLRDAYDYNVPEVLRMNYFRSFNRSSQIKIKYDLEIEFAKKYEIPWEYSLNMYAFALLPVNHLEIIFKTDEFKSYIKAMKDYNKDSISFEEFLTPLTNYIDFLDRMLVDLYGNKYITRKYQNVIFRFKEYYVAQKPVMLTANALFSVYSIVGMINDFIPNPEIMNGIAILLSIIVPNFVKKTLENKIALPKIDHAIVKLEKPKTNNIL